MRRLLPVPSSPADADLVDLDDLYGVPDPGARHVRANFVVSVDGAVELDGRSEGLGSEADKQVFRVLRWSCDVVLVGAGTTKAEDYGPAKVPKERQDRRREQGLAPVPRVAVVTTSGRLDPASRLFTEPSAAGPPLVLTCKAADTAALSGVAEVVLCGQDAVETGPMLDALTDRGLRRVLCEGGPTLLGAIAGAGALDELCLTVSPTLAGPGHGRLIGGAPWDVPRGMRLASMLEADGVLLQRWTRA